MTGKHVLVFAGSFVLAGAVLAQASGGEKPKSVSKGGSGGAVVVPDTDQKWTELSADSPGVQIADLWGDHTKGAFGALIKFPAGFTAPMHTHTSDMKLIVVSGTLIHGPEGKPETRMGPGSYLKQPGRTYRHTTVCDKASECEIFVESTGKFDLKLVDAAKAPAKK
ncbi:MAG: DUF4437 domain-containing protein [Acidobacteria bacterium]|nr:DUF4437 domain-containing protein [Acidobacteriota bacterium]MCA1612076.1 DUF4437 domain-containing protein [Acidobacteriota bacterium]